MLGVDASIGGVATIYIYLYFRSIWHFIFWAQGCIKFLLCLIIYACWVLL